MDGFLKYISLLIFQSSYSSYILFYFPKRCQGAAVSCAEWEMWKNKIYYLASGQQDDLNCRNPLRTPRPWKAAFWHNFRQIWA